MKLRKLDKNEHTLTRKLYETVFSEDTEEFVDYYYFMKIQDNEIYVIEEDGDFRSMLHLNPYTINIEKSQFQGHYIVAVATEEKYRKRRYMRNLLCQSMLDMYNRKEPFTFLMPAAEAIYTPYDFRFIYKQKRCRTKGIPGELKIELKQAAFGDVPKMVSFFKDYFSSDYQIYAEHDKKYYMTLLLEQQSQLGGIMLMKSEGDVVGLFLYTNEGELEIWEPLYLKAYKAEFYKAVYAMKGKQESVLICAASENSDNLEEQPLIMARILHVESFFALLKVKKGEKLDCSFAVLDSILMKNSRIWRITAGQDGEQNVHVKETEDSEGVLTIAALTSLLFGYKTIEQIKDEANVILSEHLVEELGKIEPFSRVFLNEVV